MKELPYYTVFSLGEDTDEARQARIDARHARALKGDWSDDYTDEARRVLGEYLRARAQEGWRVEASDAKLPDEGVVYHVSPNDLPAPPKGVFAKRTFVIPATTRERAF